MVAAAVAVIAAGAALSTGGRVRAGAAATQGERFTSYVAPAGPELAPAQAQTAAVQRARIAGQNGKLALTTVHSTFAQAHSLLMGSAPAQAEEVGPAERAEEMRSPVWVTLLTAPAGGSFSPISPLPRGRKGPAGSVMVVVADAHTGFVKEEYVGPDAPNLASLGPSVSATAPAVAGAVVAAARHAVASVRLSREEGYIAGRLSPVRIGWPVTLSARGHPRETTLSLPAGEETVAGGFGFRAMAGRYTISAPHCGRHSVRVRGRHTTSLVLHCSAGSGVG